LRDLKQRRTLVHANQFRAVKPSGEATKQKAGAATYIDDAQSRGWMIRDESPYLAPPKAVLEPSEKILGVAAKRAFSARHVELSLGHRHGSSILKRK
jgi:hypothetical protein